MKTTQRPFAAAAAVLVLALAGCTGGGIFQQDRLEFNTSGMDSAEAKTPYVRMEVTELINDGPEVLLSASGTDATGHRTFVGYSPDGGKSWEDVRFNGRQADFAPYGIVRGGGQWLALATENNRLMPYQSRDGRNFSGTGPGISFDTRHDGAMAYWSKNTWTVITKRDKSFLIHRSHDGGEWKAVAAKGIPADPNLHLFTLASNGTTTILAGQQEKSGSNVVRAAAYSSNDGGLNWTNVSPDSSKVAPGNSGFRDVHWDGKTFRFVGFGYSPGFYYGYPSSDSQTTATGLNASWAPGGTWSLAIDASWADGKEDFPSIHELTGTPARQLLLTETGAGILADYRLYERSSAPAWKAVHLPAAAKNQYNYPSDAASLPDGILVVSNVTENGNTRPKVVLLDSKGNAEDRTPEIPAAVSDAPVVSQFVAADGKVLALGSNGRETSLWTAEDGRTFKDRTRLTLAAKQSLSGMDSNAFGDVAFGAEDAWNSAKGLLWTRKPGGSWQSYSGDVFGARSLRGETPVLAAAATSRGFLAAGPRPDEDRSVTSAGLAISTDGRSWKRIDAPSFAGKKDNDRAIYTLAETPGKTLLAGGYIEKSIQDAPVVWRSTDAKSWTPVALAKTKGYTDSEVVALEAGPKSTVALVRAHQEGKGSRYVLYSSKDQGKTWSSSTELPEALGGSGYGPIHLLRDGDGFAVLGTMGTAQERKPFLYTSTDGKDFVTKDLKHDALTGANLDVNAAIIHNGKLLLSGFAGEQGNRKQFALTVDVPH